jgi:hypothetical protein
MRRNLRAIASRRRRRGLSDAVLRMALRATWREARATARDARSAPYRRLAGSGSRLRRSR